MLIVGVLASNIAVVCGIYEIAMAKEVSLREKITWITVFLIFSVLASFLYYMLRRKHMISAIQPFPFRAYA